jgi:hypothetical protein
MAAGAWPGAMGGTADFRPRLIKTYRDRIGEERMNEQETYDPHKTDTEIRQGNKRMTNLRVLLFSGILIVVAFAVIYFVGNAAEN